jgi:tetratricopeptide (TPR) repeat protein
MTKDGSDVKDALERAITLHNANRLKEAKALYRDILAEHPDEANALNLLGVLTAQEGHFDDAIRLIRKALSISEHPMFLNNLGTVFLSKEEYERAEELFLQALEKHNDYIDPVINLGKLYHEKGEYHRADGRYRSIFDRAKTRSDFLFNYGNVKREMGEHETAKELYEASLAIKGDYFDPLFNLAMLCKSDGEITRAISLFEKAKGLTRNTEKVDWFLSQCYLLLGRFTEGWALYESRFYETEYRPDLPIPRWDGARLKEEKLLVWSEQGIGDEVMFSCLIPDLMQRAAHVDYECDARLLPLFSRTYPEITFLDHKPRTGHPHEGYDLHCPAGDLPKLLSIEGKDPTSFDVLKTSEELNSKFTFQAGAAEGIQKPRVGLSYQTFSREGKERTPPVDFWKPLLETANMEFVDLQNPPDSDASLLHQLGYTGGYSLPFHLDFFNDIDALMSLIQSLDMVITIDNYIAHLAGRLGKKTVILLPLSPNWRWLLAGSDSIWYPNAHLIRQSSPGDWDGVQQELMEFFI